MGIYDRGYGTLVSIGSNLQSPMLLCLRLLWGFLFLMTGFGKFQNLSAIADYFATLGIPFPAMNALVVATIETVGGLCLVFGIYSRLAALFLASVTAVAFATAERAAVLGFVSDPVNLLMRTPFTFLLVSLILFIFGPGRFSLDRKLGQDK